MLLRKKQPESSRERAAHLIDAELNAAGSINAWLNVLVRLLQLPESRRESIREELREHLTERVRDLLLSGSPEADAVRAAIEELGETAQLARKFEAANRPRSRRILMNLTVAAITSGIVALGVVTLSPSTPSNTAHYAPWLKAEQPSPEFANAKFSIAADHSLRQVLEAMQGQTKLGLVVNWGEIEEAGGNIDDPLGLALKDAPLETALDLLADARRQGGLPLAWRVKDKTIEFGLKHVLDRREASLASYDISEVLGSLSGNYGREYAEAVADINQLLTQMVEPDSWRENGGDAATINVVGGKMFIQAPPPMHEQVDWILEQLKAGGEVKAAADDRQLPLLKDIPVIGGKKTDGAKNATDAVSIAMQTELDRLKAELAEAKDELHFAKLQFRANSPELEEKKRNLAEAQTRFDNGAMRFVPGTMQYDQRLRDLDNASDAFDASISSTAPKQP
jgi:hypothetical protein